jgi:hypothetical protein
MSGSGQSLLITVDGRGSKSVFDRLQDPSSPVNHAYPRARPSILGAAPSPMPPTDFPRVPLPSPYHSPPVQDHVPRYQSSERYNTSLGGEWHRDDHGHAFTTPGPSRTMISRSLSTGEHHLPSQHYRRHSEHSDRYDRRSPQDQRPPPLMATPTYPGHRISGRGQLMSNRGFQMSADAAHRTGLYNQQTAADSDRYGRRRAADPSRRYSQGY